MILSKAKQNWSLIKNWIRIIWESMVKRMKNPSIQKRNMNFQFNISVDFVNVVASCINLQRTHLFSFCNHAYHFNFNFQIKTELSFRIFNKNIWHNQFWWSNAFAYEQIWVWCQFSFLYLFIFFWILIVPLEFIVFVLISNIEHWILSTRDQYTVLTEPKKGN